MTQIVAGIVAGMTLLKGGEAVGRKLWNGHGGSGQPGYTPACVEHLQRLTAVETKLKGVGKTLDRLVERLDRVLEAKSKDAG